MPQTGGPASCVPLQGVSGVDRGFFFFSQQPPRRIPTNPFSAEAQRPFLRGHSSSQTVVRSQHHSSLERTAHLPRPDHPLPRIPDRLFPVGLRSSFRKQ